MKKSNGEQNQTKSNSTVYPLPTSDDPFPLVFRRLPGLKRPSTLDFEFEWLSQMHPTMEAWRLLAHAWVSHVARETEAGVRRAYKKPTEKLIRSRAAQEISRRIGPLTVFFTDYLQDVRFLTSDYATTPASFLSFESEIQDDFYRRHCVRLGRTYHYPSKTALRNPRGKLYVGYVCDFLIWSIEYLHATTNVLAGSLKCPFRRRSQTGQLLEKRIAKGQDLALSWVVDECPSLEKWRVLGEEWLREQNAGVPHRIVCLMTFIGRFLAKPHLISDTIAAEPSVFLKKGNNFHDMFVSEFGNLTGFVRLSNGIADFIDWVLLRNYSEPDDYGYPTISPAFRNPFPRVSTSKNARTMNSVHTPLPYAYIDELRRILAEGHSFSDWTWAQKAMPGQRSSWFPVGESAIDPNDPDCVFRRRSVTHNGSTYEVLEMWSPVRWVALLVKLTIPLRTFQVRMLDSGEGDSWTFDGSRELEKQSPWMKNTSNERLRAAIEARNLSGRQSKKRTRHDQEYSQGVFRREVELDSSQDGRGAQEQVLLYINTNKTSDRSKEGAAKGYVIPWPVLPWPNQQSPLSFSDAGELAQNIHYWLQKLRDWQTKYNPVTRPTAWKELVRGGVIATKSDLQLAAYTDTTFLFRDPAFWGVRESKATHFGERSRLPITDSIVRSAWCVLLTDFEKRLAERGETCLDGSPIRLVCYPDKKNSATVFFPLHSLRVSLVTALALEGGMSLTLLQKIVGHSRLVMTLYYTKPGSARMQDEIKTALGKLDEAKEESVMSFFRASSIDHLRDHAATNDFTSVIAALGEVPSNRNPAGWMPMFHGLCPVGGNTDFVDSNLKLNGCHNGGEQIVSGQNHGSPMHGPVRGGARNCVCCRWFVTEPRYLDRLVAHFNNVSYHFHVAQSALLRSNEEVVALKNERFDSVQKNILFERSKQLSDAERRFEKNAKQLELHGQTLIATYRLIQRCWDIYLKREQQSTSSSADTALVAVGQEYELSVILENTDSEMLQLSGILDDAEIYPDLETGKSILRRSQLLDAALTRDNIRPYFLTLSEDQQHLLGNEFLRRLGTEHSAARSSHRQLMQALDDPDGPTLSEALGISRDELASLLPGIVSKPLKYGKSRVFPIKSIA